jgi:organic hydroperoxide reductase OsmC/OhrA
MDSLPAVGAPRAKVLEYAASVDRAGRIATGDGDPLMLGDEWSADDLLLAALVRCSVHSLAFHARRAGMDVVASGSARGTITKPDGEERYQLVDVSVSIEAEIDPRPDDAAVAELLEKAERDCFVGASLVVKPSYDWRVR